jgi:hypothetical protein
MRNAPFLRPASQPVPGDGANGIADTAEPFRLKAADLVTEFQLACSKAALDRLLLLVESEESTAPEEAEALARTTLQQSQTLERELDRFLSVTGREEQTED